MRRNKRSQKTGLIEFLEPLLNDIFKFGDAMNFIPTWQQSQLMEAVQRGDRRVACRSGKGPGKTTVSSLIALWRALRSPKARTIITAPTMRQCKDVFMKEIRAHLERGHSSVTRFFDDTNTGVTVAGYKDWGISLVTATKETNAQGLHDENMTVIAEEASGIPDAILNAFKDTLSNPNSLFIQIGNPNSRDTAFFDCFHANKSQWHCIAWNAEETPESSWFTHERNRDIEKEFGKDSDRYRIAVLGEFPLTDPNCVFGHESLEIVNQKRLIVPAARIISPGRQAPARQFGIDFARYGGDENVIFRRSGNAVVQWEFYPHTDPNDAVEFAFQMQRDALWSDKETWYVADAGGIGQGVMKNFYKANKNILEFHSQGKAVSSGEYVNRMTEAWFTLKKLVSSARCYIPEDHQLTKQLTGRRYYTNKKGLLELESKDEYMKRGFDSPDRADALVMAFYDNMIQPGNVSSRHLNTHRPGAEIFNGMS